MPHIKIGDTVLLTSVNRNVPGGLYEVTKPKLLPHNDHEFEYRIKSASEEHESRARKRTDQGIGAEGVCVKTSDCGQSATAQSDGPSFHRCLWRICFLNQLISLSFC